MNQVQLPANELVGADHGVDVTIIFANAARGQGPGLHRHPYDELFLVQGGRATFRIGGEEVEAGPGDILVAKAGEPHGFKSSGDEPFRSVNIHLSPTFETEWLE